MLKVSDQQSIVTLHSDTIVQTHINGVAQQVWEDFRFWYPLKKKISISLSCLWRNFFFPLASLSVYFSVYKSPTTGYCSVCCRDQVYRVIPYDEAQSMEASRENFIMTHQKMNVLAGLVSGLCICWFWLQLDRVRLLGLKYWRANRMNGE